MFLSGHSGAAGAGPPAPHHQVQEEALQQAGLTGTVHLYIYMYMSL